MKKVICFVLMLFIFSFSFVSAADTTQTDVEVTDEEAVENIEEEHGFENFTDLVNQYTYFFYFTDSSGTDYLALFNASWLLNVNHIRTWNDHLCFYSWSSSVAYYISENGSDTFELLSPSTQNLSIPFGYEDYSLIYSHFENFDYISNFDLNADNGNLYSSNFEAYKAFINSGSSEPTTSFDVYASDGSMLFTDSMSATVNFISSFATPLFDKLNSFNAVTFIILISVFCFSLIFTFKVITNG